MESIKSEFLQVKVEFNVYPFKGYLIDLSATDLIRFLVHPYFSGQSIFIEGFPVQSKEIKSMKIIKTGFSVQTAILQWYHDTKTFDLYFTFNRSFDIYKDYSPIFFQSYDKSPTQKAITDLLNEESLMKTEKIKLVVKGKDEQAIKEYDDKITHIGGQISYLIGSFLMGMLQHSH